MRKLVIVVLILIAIPVVWYMWNFPTASYRYRLSIAVETDGQVHSGSSVIEVWYGFNPKWVPPAWGVYNVRIEGQAVLIDLGARGALVAALAGEFYDRTTVTAEYLAGRAFLPEARDLNGYVPTLERVRKLSRMQGRADLASDNLPALIWFSDPSNLATAKQVAPENFASIIGDATRLVSAQVEITHDPIVIDIDKKLPAYAALRRPPISNYGYTTPGGLMIGAGMFLKSEKR